MTESLQPTNIIDFKKQPPDTQRWEQYAEWIRHKILRIPVPNNIIPEERLEEKRRVRGGEL